jgi:uncharacterized protein (DUF1501 family)
MTLDATDRPLTRRGLLQAGGISMLGLGLPRLLQASASVEVSRRGPEKSCIFICLYGGASQIDTWDMKPDAPAEIRGPYKPIATTTPGLRITELMPRLARLSGRYCLVRSMTHHQPEHTRANSMLLSGQSNPAADAPALGSVLAKLRPATRDVPSYVWLQKFGGGAMPPDAAYLSGGFLGAAYAPLAVGTKDHTQDPSAPGFRVTALDAPDDISEQRLFGRMDLLGKLDAPTAFGEAGRIYSAYRERAFDLITGPAARRAFELNREPGKVRDWYGRHPLGQHLLMARRLIEAGVRLVGVVAWCGLAPGDHFLSVETWDMHGNGTPIFGTGWNSLGWAVPRLDEALSALLEDLELRGLLPSTLVVAVGEFGRTPKIDPGGKGRNHWPHCYSALLAGGEVRGGCVYGASDRHAAYVKDRPVSPEDFAATLLNGLGVPPQTRLGADGFTRPASTGQPIVDLLG